MYSKEQFHAAAEIIKADGAQGVYSASRIVGRDAALGMLILFLRQSSGVEDTTEKVDELLKSEGLLNIVHYSPILGHGVVYDEDGPAYVMTVQKMHEPELAAGVHLGMWMQGPDDLRVIPAGNLPFRQAYDEMSRAHDAARDDFLEKARKR